MVASDAPTHTDAEALTGEQVSEVFVVDTTPPVPGVADDCNERSDEEWGRGTE